MADGEMTLAFHRAALERLARPADAVADARRWSDHVGVVDDAPVADAAVVEAVEPDFVSGEGGTAGSLAAVRQQFPSDRHVFVGATESDRNTAQALGWEYLPVERAAEKAGWPLAGLDE